MAKYIGTYASSGDVQTALDNQELSRPFIAYTTDNDKVIFGPAADRAEVGDIVVYSVADDLLHYIKQADYNTTSYPAANYVPVGVVAYPQTDDAILGPTGEITFMGLNWVAPGNPDNGQATYADNMLWGLPDFDIPELTNYTTTASVITDMNGKANTEIVLGYCSANTAWKTASRITDAATQESPFPIFEITWRYKTSGTVQGDWFVPAAGQVDKLFRNENGWLDKINSGFTAVGAGELNSLWIQSNYALSNETSAGYFWRFTGQSSKYVSTDSKKYARVANRPYCSKLMTRI